MAYLAIPVISSNTIVSATNTPVKNRWRFQDKNGNDIKVAINGNVHSNSGEISVAISVPGAGIVLEPDFVVTPWVKDEKLVEILKNFRPPPSNIYAVYPSRRHLSAKVRTFVDFLGTHFADARALR